MSVYKIHMTDRCHKQWTQCREGDEEGMTELEKEIKGMGKEVADILDAVMEAQLPQQTMYFISSKSNAFKRRYMRAARLSRLRGGLIEEENNAEESAEEPVQAAETPEQFANRILVDAFVSPSSSAPVEGTSTVEITGTPPDPEPQPTQTPSPETSPTVVGSPKEQSPKKKKRAMCALTTPTNPPKIVDSRMVKSVFEVVQPKEEEEPENPSFIPCFRSMGEEGDHYGVVPDVSLSSFLRLEAAFRDRTGEQGAKLMQLLKRKALRFVKSDYDLRHLTYSQLEAIVVNAVGAAMVPSEDEERVRRLLTNDEVTRMRTTHAVFAKEMAYQKHGAYCKLRSAILAHTGPMPDVIKVLYGRKIG